MNMNNEFKEFLPLLIPIAIAEFSLFGYTLHHILKHDKYKHGNRTLWLWVVILGMNFIGPVLYLILGKEEE